MKLDISSKKDKLKNADYLMFVHLIEPVPAEIKMKKTQQPLDHLTRSEPLEDDYEIFNNIL